jgi:hypothetical protein
MTESLSIKIDLIDNNTDYITGCIIVDLADQFRIFG